MSPIDSPRLICSSSLRRITGVPPSSAIPTSNETRVRVEGCSKITRDRLARKRARARPPGDRPSARRPDRAGRRAAPASSSPVMKSESPDWSGAIEARQITPAGPRGEPDPERCERAAAVAAPILRGDGPASPHLEPLPRSRPSSRGRPADVAIPPPAHDRARRRTRPGEPRPPRASSPRRSRRRNGTSHSCRSARRAGPSRSRPPRDAEAHLVPTSRNLPYLARVAIAGGDLEPRSDRLLGGRIEPDPGPHLGRRAGGSPSGAACGWRRAPSGG